MYINRTNPIPPAQRSTSIAGKRGGQSFQGILEIEQISEDAVVAGEHTGERKRDRAPHKEPPRDESADEAPHSGLDVKV